MYEEQEGPRAREIRLELVEADCLETGVALKRMGYNVAVLNMASMSHPGGGYRNGAGAQEGKRLGK